MLQLIGGGLAVGVIRVLYPDVTPAEAADGRAPRQLDATTSVATARRSGPRLTTTSQEPPTDAPDRDRRQRRRDQRSTARPRTRPHAPRSPSSSPTRTRTSRSAASPTTSPARSRTGATSRTAPTPTSKRPACNSGSTRSPSSIDVDGTRAAGRRPRRRARRLSYDALIVGTGAVPVRPPIAGSRPTRARRRRAPAALDGRHLRAHQDPRTRRHPKRAVIVGAGYIGLEMAEGLTTRGLSVTQIEQLPEVLPTVDPELGALVHAELERHGVDSLLRHPRRRDRQTAPTAIGAPLEVRATGPGGEQLGYRPTSCSSSSASGPTPNSPRRPAPSSDARRDRRRPADAHQPPRRLRRRRLRRHPPPAARHHLPAARHHRPQARTHRRRERARRRAASSRAASAPRSSRSSTSSPPAPACATTRPQPPDSSRSPSPPRPTTTRPTTPAATRSHALHRRPPHRPPARRAARRPPRLRGRQTRRHRRRRDPQRDDRRRDLRPRPLLHPAVALVHSSGYRQHAGYECALPTDGPRSHVPDRLTRLWAAPCSAVLPRIGCSLRDRRPRVQQAAVLGRGPVREAANPRDVVAGDRRARAWHHRLLRAAGARRGVRHHLRHSERQDAAGRACWPSWSSNRRRW